MAGSGKSRSASKGAGSGSKSGAKTPAKTRARTGAKSASKSTAKTTLKTTTKAGAKAAAKTATKTAAKSGKTSGKKTKARTGSKSGSKPAPKRPLVIVDNSLIDERGHHLALANTLTLAALDEGRPVSIYAHQDLDAGLLAKGVTVKPVFTMSVYELFARKLRDHDMSPELIAVLEQIETDHPDGARILFHTADAYTFCAIESWLAGRKRRGAGRVLYDVHVITPYEPRLMPGFALKGVVLYRALERLARWNDPETRACFWSETARLAEYYRRGFSMRTVVQPLPTPQWALHPPKLTVTRPDNALVLLFLGAARGEKGFLHLPALAEEIANRPGLPDRVVMRLHRSAPIVGFAPEVERAFDALADYPFVEFIDGSLELDDYAQQMHGCDMMLLLYDRSSYFARGSGIAMEALSAGKHILGTVGTFMQDLEHQGLAHFGSDAAGWADHVERLTRALPATRAKGAAVGTEIARRYAPDRYLARLEARERHAAQFSSLRSLDIQARMPAMVSDTLNATTQSHLSS